MPGIPPMTKEPCEKRCYVTFEVAQEVADRRSGQTGEEIEAYICTKCGWSHLTNRTKRRHRVTDRRKRRRR